MDMVDEQILWWVRNGFTPDEALLALRIEPRFTETSWSTVERIMRQELT